jgi:hypothetical protein
MTYYNHKQLSFAPIIVANDSFCYKQLVANDMFFSSECVVNV